MGSGRSKSCQGSSLSSTVREDSGVAQPPSSSTGGGGRRRRSMSMLCSLHSSCLASSSTSHDSDDDDEQVCNGWMRKSSGTVSRRRMESRNQKDAEEDCYDKELKDKKKSENGRHCDEHELELELDDDCGVEEEATVSNVQMRNVSGSIQESSSTPGHVLSHFKFIPGNISSRLSRASSSRSFNTAYPVSSSRQTIEREEGVTSPTESATRLIDRVESPRIPVMDNVVRDMNAMSSLRSPRVVNVMDTSYAGIVDRRHVVVREPSIDRNVRFSRTLSVGRLRDRVLRRSSLSDFTFRPSPHQGEDDADLFSADTAAAEDTPVTSTSILNRSASTIRRTLFGIQDHETPSPLVREGRYQGLLEHRSDFLERRRRIRSQVRALQRLGSRFENVTSHHHHERSCVLSGQDQAGRCTCRAITSRGSTAATTTDETNARASISRIVLLAEALFEVLDEIHQQSVVLSSQQPSVSSIGSVPAPNDVVDLLPTKLYTKSQSEESSQCYICLVEYEEGDTIRTLPCHHEFHTTCVDKWLKEIHRVCPLCRGDICRHDPSPEQH
uniref:RING-type domain-containing protein n=1 Tax=Noccaea caerulescens TaxID=107243 RepID=A0A1J3DNA7_NOCCA